MPELLVACLCAQWCGTCRDYVEVFEAAPRGPGQRWVWVDIEDHAEVLGEVDVENFPTLLIARGDAVVFFGSVTPQAQTLKSLVERAGELAVVDDDEVRALARRVGAVASSCLTPLAGRGLG